MTHFSPHLHHSVSQTCSSSSSSLLGEEFYFNVQLLVFSSDVRSASRENRQFPLKLGSIQLITDYSLNDKRLRLQALLIVGFLGLL